MNYDEVYECLQELSNLLKQLVRYTNLRNRRGTLVSTNAARHWVANIEVKSRMAAMVEPRKQLTGVCIEQILI